MEKKKAILFVEDDASLRNALRNKLAHEGFSVLEAKNGEKGLKIAFGDHPDLIILDIVMPGMHGYEVLKSLKNDKWGRNIPILILTNFPDYPGVKELVDDKDYLVKTSVTMADIVKRAKKLLKM